MEPEYSWQAVKSSGQGYQRDQSSRRFRLWMFLAILLAFLFHAGLVYLFKRATIFEMVAAFEETLQVNQERERVTLDEITLDR
ncbi:MAG: hypothetical protein AAF191_05470, partial [Verrucomicrobiota bacterium]